MLTGVEEVTGAWFVVVLGAFVASGLTLFSGFGLGTLLLPAFALVFPLRVAVAATAVVHLANNVVKLGLVGKPADRAVVLRFGLPAVFGAFVGAWVLTRLPEVTWLHWRLGERVVFASGVEVVLGVMIVVFALFDLLPALRAWQVSRRHLLWGGALSGFFGGLSGHQGALRSVFLTKLGFDARTFVATGVWVAVLVDVGRLFVYGFSFATDADAVFVGRSGLLVVAAMVTAFLGAFVGKRLLGKVTIGGVRWVVGVLLVLVGAGMASGLLGG